MKISQVDGIASNIFTDEMYWEEFKAEVLEQTSHLPEFASCHTCTTWLVQNKKESLHPDFLRDIEAFRHQHKKVAEAINWVWQYAHTLKNRPLEYPLTEEILKRALLYFPQFANVVERGEISPTQLIVGLAAQQLIGRDTYPATGEGERGWLCLQDMAKEAKEEEIVKKSFPIDEWGNPLDGEENE